MKRYAFNLILALVGVGIPVFAVLVFYPVMADWHDRAAELTEAEIVLGRWLRAMELPTRTRVDTESRYTAAMAAEYGRAHSYYQSRDRLLERSILDSHTDDPVRVKLTYLDLRADLAKKGRCPSDKGFMPSYAWERPKQAPLRSEFKTIEKQACIADVLVGLLAPAGPCLITKIAISDPVEPFEASAEEGFDGFDTQGMGIEEEAPGYVLWPVDLEFEAPFVDVGTLLATLAAPSDRYPPMLMHSLGLKGLEKGRVAVHVGLRVLDFD